MIHGFRNLKSPAVEFWSHSNDLICLLFFPEMKSCETEMRNRDVGIFYAPSLFFGYPFTAVLHFLLTQTFAFQRLVVK